jgi:hypothetical protein
MSKIGGSGIARKEIKNPFCFFPAFDRRVVLPSAAIGLALRLILPVYEGYRLKPLPSFGNFLKAFLFLNLIFLEENVCQ